MMTGLTSEENLIKSSGASAHEISLARIASQTVARSASTFEKMIMPLTLDASVINVVMGVVMGAVADNGVEECLTMAIPQVQSLRSPPSPLDVEPDVLPAGRNARSADARFAIVIDCRMM